MAKFEVAVLLTYSSSAEMTIVVEDVEPYLEYDQVYKVGDDIELSDDELDMIGKRIQSGYDELEIITAKVTKVLG